MNSPMKTSLLLASETLYATRISEYVNPPATKTITRCLGSFATLLLAPLVVQTGFADRSEPGAEVEGVREVVETSTGASRT